MGSSRRHSSRPALRSKAARAQDSWGSARSARGAAGQAPKSATSSTTHRPLRKVPGSGDCSRAGGWVHVGGCAGGKCGYVSGSKGQDGAGAGAGQTRVGGHARARQRALRRRRRRRRRAEQRVQAMERPAACSTAAGSQRPAADSQQPAAGSQRPAALRPAAWQPAHLPQASGLVGGGVQAHQRAALAVQHQHILVPQRQPVRLGAHAGVPRLLRAAGQVELRSRVRTAGRQGGVGGQVGGG